MRKNRIRRLRDELYFNSRPFRPNPVSAKWWSDPPKLIPIIISVLALTLSILSWLESHRGRLMNEEVNRPVLSLNGIETSSGGGYIVGIEDNVLNFYVKLKNTGKVSGKITEAKVEPSQIKLKKCETRKSPVDTGEVLNPLQEMLPNLEETIFGEVLLPRTCLDEEKIDFVVSITVEYVDVVSGKKYFQVFVESVSVVPEVLIQSAKTKYGIDLRTWRK